MRKMQALGIGAKRLLSNALADSPMPEADRALCHELVSGIVRWQRTLDWLAKRKTNDRLQKPAVRDLLRLGLYQLFWLDRIPNHAAVNETTQLAREFGAMRQAGFINAVLRAYARERGETEAALEALKQESPALGYSHPDWLFDRWKRVWGRDRAIDLMEWNNQPPPLFARMNQLLATPETLLQQWAGEGIVQEPFEGDWTGGETVYRLRSHPPLKALKSFREGGFYVQDPSTLLTVAMLNPGPGESVLDLCAAPGGKTCAISGRMENQARLVAHDSSHERLSLLRENCRRLGVTPAEIVHADEFSPEPESFDRILVDAPCSNTGVMRRRLELRWRIRPEEIERLASLQLGLLRQAAPWLKPGGALVYSTCSLEPRENGEVTEHFLQEHPGWHSENQRLLNPMENGVDGAFAALLRKPG